MIYRNGKEALPPDLLTEVQKYLQGELLYVPKPDNDRAGWGELSGSKQWMKQRNEEIVTLYRNGWPIHRLEQKYHLSAESVRKIIMKTPKAEKS